MNNVGSFILILVCVAIGYVLEPVFFGGDRKEAPVSEKSPASVTDDSSSEEADEFADGDDSEDVQVAVTSNKVDLTQFTQADFPEKVTLKIAHVFSDTTSGLSMHLKEGVKVKPLRFEDGLLVIQPVGYPVEGKIEVENTDFLALAEPRKQTRLSGASVEVVTSDEGMGQGGAEEVAPKESVIDEKVEEIPEVVVETPIVEEDTVKAEEPAGDVTEGVATSDTGAVVKMMKASVAAGKVTEFDAKQVVAWKAGKPLTLNGKKYQTGVVTFKAETILGMQEHDALALISNGSVVKWLWVKTKLEMR